MCLMILFFIWSDNQRETNQQSQEGKSAQVPFELWKINKPLMPSTCATFAQQLSLLATLLSAFCTAEISTKAQ